MDLAGLPHMRPEDVVLGAISPRGKRILDVGCGTGRWMRILQKGGAEPTGIEIDADKVAAASAEGAGPVKLARAEALPFADAAFDAVLFINSLHHVPTATQGEALREAARVVVPRGTVAVLEPVAAGPFQEVLAVIDDETEVRAAAQRAISAACEDDALERRSDEHFVSDAVYGGFEAFCAAITGVDPEREVRLAEHRAEVEALFRQHGRAAKGAVSFDAPHRFTVLSRP